MLCWTICLFRPYNPPQWVVMLMMLIEGRGTWSPRCRVTNQPRCHGTEKFTGMQDFLCKNQASPRANWDGWSPYETACHSRLTPQTPSRDCPCCTHSFKMVVPCFFRPHAPSPTSPSKGKGRVVQRWALGPESLGPNPSFITHQLRSKSLHFSLPQFPHL